MLDCRLAAFLGGSLVSEVSDFESRLYEVENGLKRFQDQLLFRLSAMDEAVSRATKRSSESVTARAVSDVATNLESRIEEMRRSVDLVRRQMELYMTAEQLKGHTHDGKDSLRVDYANLDGNPLSQILNQKADVARGYAEGGQAMTGTPIRFKNAYVTTPVVLVEPLSAQGGLPVESTSLESSQLGFTLRAYSSKGEVKGIPFSYLVWKL